MNPSSTDAVRREQIAEGARMAREDRGGGDNFSFPNRPLLPRRTLVKKPGGSAPKGHEAFLKALETSGAEIRVEKKSSGDIVVGTVKHSDKFSITVKVAVGEGQFESRVIFKHDISEFRALTPNPAKAQPQSEDAGE